MEKQVATTIPADMSSCAVAVRDTRYRIDSPNSRRRFIEVVGIGDGGERLGRLIAAKNLEDVHVVLDAAAQAKANGGQVQVLEGADMLFVVACDGDDVSLAPFLKQAARRSQVQITGILIQQADAPAEPAGLALLRASSDVLVIATSQDYVIDMLVQLGV